MNVSDRHPFDRVVDHVGGEGRIIIGWLAAILGLLVVTPEGSSTGALAFVVLIFGTGAIMWHRNHHLDKRENGVADLQARYADGEIDLATFEAEVELLLNDRAQEIRDRVEDVGGVGPATAANIALRFRSLDDVRAADVEALEQVNGVGPQRAEAIVERLGGRSR